MAVKAIDVVEATRQYIGAPYRWWSGVYPEHGPPSYMDWKSPNSYIPDFVRREGVNCSGLINLARMECGLEPIGTTGQYQEWIEASGGVAFDPSTPGVPGALVVHGGELWMGTGIEGHIAMYTGAHTLIQAEGVYGVWEGEQDYDSTNWANYLIYGLMPDVDYSENQSSSTSFASSTGDPARALQITLAYDKDGWAYDTASGLYVKSLTADLDHKTNKDGWLWASVGTTATAGGTTATAGGTTATPAEPAEPSPPVPGDQPSPGGGQGGPGQQGRQGGARIPNQPRGPAVGPGSGQGETTRGEFSTPAQSAHITQQRYINVCIARYGYESCLSNITSLAADEEYRLRLDIGSLSTDSVVENPKPFPTELLPRTEDGHWLEVVAASDHFQIAPRRYSLFLPRLGFSWVCDCPPGGEHICSQSTRRPHLFIPIRAPQSPGNATLRISVYFEKNLIQSQLLTAQIGETEQLGSGHSSTIDYTLTADLSDVSFLPRRNLNILTNHNADGTHRIILNGESPGVLAFTLTEGQMRDTVNAAREALRNIHFEEYGGQLGGRRQRRNLLNKNNGKNKQGLLEDLQRLAPLGWDLWNCVLSGEPEWWGRLSMPGAIQVSRTTASTFIFPWALLYDIPLESNTQYRACPLLEDWDRAKILIDESARSCPYESQHERKNILCPFGFWGFKHIIEQPPSMPKGRNLPLIVQANKEPAALVAGLSLKLDRQLTRKHVEAMKGRLEQFELVECNSLPKIITAMADPVELVYFYCHGRREELQGTTQLIPYLEVGDNDQFNPSDITVWRQADWPPQHWQDTSPLVFINACHTAELTPESVINFVDAFTNAYASGVVGTEIVLEQGVASEAAEQFFSYFQQNGATVGQALHQMRLHFLMKGNLLGLAYTPYCSTDLKFSGSNHRAS